MSKVIPVVIGMAQLDLEPGRLTAEPLNPKLIIKLLETQRFTKPFSRLPTLPTLGRGKNRN